LQFASDVYLTIITELALSSNDISYVKICMSAYNTKQISCDYRDYGDIHCFSGCNKFCNGANVAEIKQICNLSYNLIADTTCGVIAGKMF
ncbi:MAG: hypothetical protein P8Y47_05260, partial [Alphaproteobacteria bacterium]